MNIRSILGNTLSKLYIKAEELYIINILQKVFDYFTKNQATFTGNVDFTNATVTGLAGGDSRPYKVYSALLSQTGTSAPTAVVLENTLGGTPVFSYVGAGEYRLTLTGAFPQLKYFSLFPVSFFNSTPGDGVVTYYWFRENDNSILITCLEGNSELNNAPIGFIVYN